MSDFQPPTDAPARGMVIIAEQTTFGDEDWATGMFDAHWESADGSDMRQGPDGVSASEAVRWGRSQADAFYVRGATGEEFSSGAARDASVPEWPDDGVVFERRTLRSECRARVSVGRGIYSPPDVHAKSVVDVSGALGRERAETLARVLREVVEVTSTEVREVAGEGWGLDCVVATPHRGAAMEILVAGSSGLETGVGRYFGAVTILDES